MTQHECTAACIGLHGKMSDRLHTEAQRPVRGNTLLYSTLFSRFGASTHQGVASPPPKTISALYSTWPYDYPLFYSHHKAPINILRAVQLLPDFAFPTYSATSKTTNRVPHGSTALNSNAGVFQRIMDACVTQQRYKYSTVKNACNV